MKKSIVILALLFCTATAAFSQAKPQAKSKSDNVKSNSSESINWAEAWTGAWMIYQNSVFTTMRAIRVQGTITGGGPKVKK